MTPKGLLKASNTAVMIKTMVTRRTFLAQTGAATLLAAAEPRGGLVQTVSGAVEASKLGLTLTHEHICACTPEFWKRWPDSFGGRNGFVARAVGVLVALREQGVGTLVDLSPHDVGRDVRLMEEISRQSGMRIVACTGQHLFATATRTTDELLEQFVGDIERGIDGTQIRAGVIKVATAGAVVSEAEEAVLRAAARASKLTGIPIATHTHARLRGGEFQAAIFESERVSPARVCLGHSDDSGDMDYLVGLAGRGYTLGMDHVNRGLNPDARPSWRERAAQVKGLVDAGFADRLFLSQDTVLGDAMLPAELQGAREKTNPDGMFFNTRVLLDHLKSIGVTERQIRTITIENPARFLGRGTMPGK
jgi:phosphotriesterase-related protein